MSDHEALATNHKRIWLQPLCCTDERHWCEDPQPCDECGLPAIEYMRADLIPAPLPSYGALLAEIDAAAKIIREGHGHLSPETIARQILALLPAQEGWRTIETAPKDGAVFIYQSDDEAVSTCNWQFDDCGFSWWDIAGDQIARPVRWMPLPAIVADNHAESKP